MQVLDFIIITYYILLRKAKQNQLSASITGATVLPLAFWLIALIFYVTRILFPDNSFFNPIIIAVTLGLLMLVVNKLLMVHYEKQLGRLNRICDKYEKFKFFSIVFYLFYVFSSIYLFLGTMKYAMLLPSPH